MACRLTEVASNLPLSLSPSMTCRARSRSPSLVVPVPSLAYRRSRAAEDPSPSRDIWNHDPIHARDPALGSTPIPCLYLYPGRDPYPSLYLDRPSGPGGS